MRMSSYGWQLRLSPTLGNRRLFSAKVRRNWHSTAGEGQNTDPTISPEQWCKPLYELRVTGSGPDIHPRAERAPLLGIK